MLGEVVASFGKEYLIKCNQKVFKCISKIKKDVIATGDKVKFSQNSEKFGIIEELIPRKNLLYRSDKFKKKIIATNISQIVIVIATEPDFNEEFISRALIAAKAADISAKLLLNKIDLISLLNKSRQKLYLFSDLGYEIYEVSTKMKTNKDLKYLKKIFEDKSSVLIGQSGVGKSSIVNILVPNASLKVKEISLKLNSGKHTTVATRMFNINENSSVIDSPGFNEYGLNHLDKNIIESFFPEFKIFLNKCRFHNCIHLNEPDCVIIEAVKKKLINFSRHNLYKQLVTESIQKKNKY